MIFLFTCIKYKRFGIQVLVRTIYYIITKVFNCKKKKYSSNFFSPALNIDVLKCLPNLLSVHCTIPDFSAQGLYSGAALVFNLHISGKENKIMPNVQN